ncbi:MAG TPA: PDZ domain-containing protein, partial [Acidobacteriaceae bacterium]
RFVEGIFEELDAPGEWFLDEAKNTLFYYPLQGTDLKKAVVEIVRLKHLVEFQGSASAPVRWINLQGLVLQHAARTFMDIREPLLRSDWRIYRGGAVFLTGTEDCGIDLCHFDQLGGNAIFANQYNRRLYISRCHISNVGGNGICFVGDRAAVRNPLDSYDQRLSVDQLDLTPGPLTSNYPADCLVEDSLIYRTGRVEKQSAPIEISMSMSITVRHVSIYDVPRAGINIGDGCWGGHRIDSCDIFDTVKETGDHGSFNSWARDRWWGIKGVSLDTVMDTQKYKDLPVLDAVLPITLTNSRWRCDHGWDIDLDDGSSNYHITNNLCLNGGLKLREGFYRACENNVLVNNSLHAHVWYLDSRDIFRFNIVFAAYQPVNIRKWGQELDYNLVHRPHAQKLSPAIPLQAQSAQDKHSLMADAKFISPRSGDYRVRPGSPALALGFRNFDMSNFGVQAPELKGIAKQPLLPDPLVPAAPSTIEARSRKIAMWAGAKVRNVAGLDEVSALGAPGENGAVVLDVPPGSLAANAGFEMNDVILAFNTRPIKELQDLIRASNAVTAGEESTVAVLRRQQPLNLQITLK